jgi:hypothetical protein
VLVRQLLFIVCGRIASSSLMLVTLCSPVCVWFILNKCQFVAGIEAKRGDRFAGSMTVALKVILSETILAQ